jgi:CheY-like chemotaxis protein
MGGLTLAKAIKTDGPLQGMRLVLLTSFGQPGNADEIGAASIAACLTKPVHQLELHDCLAMVLGAAGAAVPACSSDPAPRTRVLVAEDNAVNQKVFVQGRAQELTDASTACATLERTLEQLRPLLRALRA